MLPVVDRPPSSTWSRRPRPAGLDDVLFVNAESKGAIEAHFDPAADLEESWPPRKRHELLALVRRVERAGRGALGHPARADAGSVTPCSAPPTTSATSRSGQPRRHDPRRWHRAGGAHGRDPRALRRQRRRALRGARSSRSAVRLRRRRTDRRGRRGAHHRRWSRSRRPRRRRAISRSSAATCSTRAVFDVLRDTAPGRGGEIQLTDAIRRCSPRVSPSDRRAAAVPRPRLRHRRQARVPAELVQFAWRSDLADEIGPGCASTWTASRSHAPRATPTLTSVDAHLPRLHGIILPAGADRARLATSTAWCWPRTCGRHPLPSFDHWPWTDTRCGSRTSSPPPSRDPVTLPVTARSRRATPDVRAPAGHRAQIMTGAMVPHGTEAVVPVEVDRRRHRPGRHPRPGDYGHAIRLRRWGREGRRGAGSAGTCSARCTSR